MSVGNYGESGQACLGFYVDVFYKASGIRGWLSTSSNKTFLSLEEILISLPFLVKVQEVVSNLSQLFEGGTHSAFSFGTCPSTC